eukprot:gene8176-11061_t
MNKRKQAGQLNWKIHKKSVSTSTSSASSQSWNKKISEKLIGDLSICPVCSNSIPEDISLQNMHIDLCLKQINENYKSENYSFDRLGIDYLDKKSKQTKNKLTVDKSVVHMYCPICKLKIQNNDSCFMNMHIDQCLQQQNSSKKIEINSNSLTLTNNSISNNNSNYKIYKDYNNLSGLYFIENFLTEEEEISLLSTIDNDNNTTWRHSSFNGHCLTKCYGVRTEFGLPGKNRVVRQNNPNTGEYNIPPYLIPYIHKLKDIIIQNYHLFPKEIHDFIPNECNINNYLKQQKCYLRPHYDDRTLSGPVLMNLSLCGRSRMTYSLPNNINNNKIINIIDLPTRCLQLVTGDARWKYMHEIKEEDLLDERRVSITWRRSDSGYGKGIQELEVSKEENIISKLTSGTVTHH